MTLKEAIEEKAYAIKAINTGDDEIKRFLFTLGCYSGEQISVISRKKHSCVISVKDGRYSIDLDLAEAIEI